jgi:hypothetical protein
MKRMFRKGEEGVSLMEAVVALAILVTLIIGAFVVTADHLRHVRSLRESEVALYLAQARLEEIWALGGDGLRRGVDRPFSIPAADRRGFAEIRGLESVVEREPGLLEVTVRVLWRGRSKRPGAIALVSLIAKGARAPGGGVR